jgi:hypothetical protein
VREKEDHALFLSTHTGLEGWREGNDLSIFSPSSLHLLSFTSLLYSTRFARDKQLTDSPCRRRWRACTQMRSLSWQIFLFSEAAAICCSRNNLVPSLCQFQTFREHEIVIDVKRFHPAMDCGSYFWEKQAGRTVRYVFLHTQDMRAQRSVRESTVAHAGEPISGSRKRLTDRARQITGGRPWVQLYGKSLAKRQRENGMPSLFFFVHISLGGGHSIVAVWAISPPQTKLGRRSPVIVQIAGVKFAE